MEVNTNFCCPDCNWYPPDSYYYIKNFEVIECNNNIKHNVYPKYLDRYTDWKNRKCFRKVFKCGKCLKEFEQSIIVEINNDSEND